MAKSKNVTTRTFYPYPNSMVVERLYEYEKGKDAKRPEEKLPKELTDGWKKEFMTGEVIQMDGGHMWTTYTFFSKKAMSKGKSKRHFTKAAGK
jgi:hypothetical protein